MAERHATQRDGAHGGRRLRLEEELRTQRFADAEVARREDDLQICPECGRDLVIPVDWAPGDPGYWHVSLRCPECEWRGSGTYHQKVVDRFDEALDEGTQALLEDLRLLSRANLEEEIERFADALRRDLILPEDF
ncbi:MAG TPA: hypothetical protein VIL04_13925 [Solirubrobacterales bacterium]|jgi:hypothetical protein